MAEPVSIDFTVTRVDNVVHVWPSHETAHEPRSDCWCKPHLVTPRIEGDFPGRLAGNDEPVLMFHQ